MLASDPHLAITTPSFWYEVKLYVEGQARVMGIGVPGLPGLLVGNTEHLAWGLTNGYSNVADVFRVTPGGEGRFTLGGTSYERRSFRPLVRVKVGPLYLPVFWKSFWRSDLGPFLPLPEYAEGSVLLRWTAFHQRPGTLQAALGLLRARTVQQASGALSRWQLPCWNFVFADSSGGIGYRQVGLVARRKAGARGLVDGAAAPAQQWQGFLGPDEMPQLLNPARGYIVTANNRAFPHSYPLYMGQAYAWSQRAARIEALIQGKPRLTLADLQRIQLDARVPQAALLLPRMLELLERGGRPTSPHAARALKLLQSWDLQARRQQVAPTIFRFWLERMLEPLVRGLSPRPRDQVLARMLRGEIRPQTGQPLPALARQTLDAALTALARDLGPDPATWRWGRVHVTPFQSLLAERAAWSPGDRGTDGDKRTVNVADYAGGSPPFRVQNAPSYRLLIELGPGLTSRGVLAGKQVDARPTVLGPQQKMWLEGAYRPRALPGAVAGEGEKQEQITF
jgi:penicillin amidase